MIAAEVERQSPVLLQLVMGWTNCHLHSFHIGERAFSMSGYEYDFGDSWRHRIEVKTIANPNTEWFYPWCIAGARAAPPEDVGGVGGYFEFLSAINDPKHEEHDSMLVWIGGAFDPERTVNRDN